MLPLSPPLPPSLPQIKSLESELEEVCRCADQFEEELQSQSQSQDLQLMDSQVREGGREGGEGRERGEGGRGRDVDITRRDIIVLVQCTCTCTLEKRPEEAKSDKCYSQVWCVVEERKGDCAR